MNPDETANIEGDPAETGAAPAEQLARARQLMETGAFADAAALLKALLEARPEPDDEVEILYMLAVTQRYGGRAAAAAEALDALLARYPEFGRGHQERGHLLLAMNAREDALKSYARAVELNPALVASWKALADLHTRAGEETNAALARQEAQFLEKLPPELISVTGFLHEDKLYKAEQICRHFLQNNKHNVEAMRLLAEIGVRLQIYDDAEFLLESCVEFEPDNIRARIDYLNILTRKQKFEKAHEQAQHLIRQYPDNPVFQTSLGTTYVGLGRFDEGMALYRKVLDGDPDQPRLHLLLGHAQKTVGDVEAAIESYRTAYRLKPDFGDAFWSLANIKTYRFSDEEIAHIRQYESDPATSAEDRIHLCFAAGKALEDRGEFDASFEYYDRGNALKREETRYDDEQFQQRVHLQMQVCTPALFEQRRGVGCDRPDPIFIVGLPRAGSTLLEQILASHSQVDATMELHDILGLAQRLRGRSANRDPRYPGILRELDPDYFRRFGEQYLENTRVYRGDAPYFIDKMPNNFLHVGLIRLILPRAKIIDARRHPMACCFSGFKQLFGEGQEFTYGLAQIGRYYKGYVRLMDHWDEVLPGFVLRVMHEDVVNDLETQVRRILDFCGLPFEQACLDFHKTERSIRTPSSEQVKQPINRSGLEQWRNYASHLEPLREALGPEILARYPE